MCAHLQSRNILRKDPPIANAADLIATAAGATGWHRYDISNAHSPFQLGRRYEPLTSLAVAAQAH